MQPLPVPQIQDVVEPFRLDPGIEIRLHQFGQWRTGYHYVLVDVEFQPREPGAIDQIGGRLAFVYPPFQKVADRSPFGKGEPTPMVCTRQIRRKVQGMQHQLGRLVQRIIGAVTEEQAFRIEAAGPPADEILNCQKPFG